MGRVSAELGQRVYLDANIVRVEALLQLADQLEARYRRAKAQVNKLQQSILAKAFRGELVPTEAALARQTGREYEPASVLLERIRQTREGRQPSVKTTTRKPERLSSKGNPSPFRLTALLNVGNEGETAERRHENMRPLATRP